MILLTKIRDGLLKVATHTLRLAQRSLGVSTVGVRALIMNNERQVLLVKHTYLPGWHFPGGGVKPRENPQDAIVRELWEEAGITVKGNIELFGVYYHQVRGVNDYPILYIVTDFNQQQQTNIEIAEIGWFSVSELPEDTTIATRTRIEEYLNNKPISADW